MNRREFNQGLFAGGLLAGGMPAVTIAIGSANEQGSIGTCVVYDERVVSTSEIHRLLERTVHESICYDGNFSPWWFDRLHELCGERNALLVGMTRHSDFLIFRTMSERHGYKLTDHTSFPEHVLWTLMPT